PLFALLASALPGLVLPACGLPGLVLGLVLLLLCLRAAGDGDPGALLDLDSVLPGEGRGHRQGDAAETALGLGRENRGQRGVRPLGEVQLEAADGSVGNRGECRAGDALLDVDAADEVERDAFALKDYDDIGERRATV